MSIEVSGAAILLKPWMKGRWKIGKADETLHVLVLTLVQANS